MILHHSYLLKVYCPGINLPEALKSSKMKGVLPDDEVAVLEILPCHMAHMISYDKKYIGNRLAISCRQFYLTFLFSGASKTIFSILELQVDGTSS